MNRPVPCIPVKSVIQLHQSLSTQSLKPHHCCFVLKYHQGNSSGRTTYTNKTLWLHSSLQVSRIYNLHLNWSCGYLKESVPVAISFGFLHLWLSFGKTNCSDPFEGKLILLTSCLPQSWWQKNTLWNQMKNLVSTVVAHI